MDHRYADAIPPPIPPVPQRTRHLATTQQSGGGVSSGSNSLFSRRRSLQGPAAANSHRTNAELNPASPEVISSLITSLSVISQPADRHFESQPLTSLSLPASPRNGSFGSFGVEYGAYSNSSNNNHTTLSDLREEEGLSLDELPASAPVVRTSKPPSGYSSLTAPKSPRDTGGGLKSILRSGSRPSSKGSSQGSRDDAQSIGNLSIERGATGPPSTETNRSRSRSRDSWGKKQGRAARGLMYMSSKERLREKEYEKKRGGSIGGSMDERASITSGRPDPFLAETAISEEPTNSAAAGPSASSYDATPSRSARNSSENAPSPRPIPARDSSLRKSGKSSSKRASGRTSRSQRDGEATPDIIPEVEEHGSGKAEKRRSKHRSWQQSAEEELNKRTTDAARASTSSPTQHPTASASAQLRMSTRLDEYRVEGSTTHTDSGNTNEDGAPFPAVSQGRRREDHSVERLGKKPGRTSSEAGDPIRLKRSSSRLKRLSGPLSPRSDAGSDMGRADAKSPEPSMPAGYERPRSADSVDDAVESYLCSPRLSQKIKHPQTGRIISFSEVGDSEGYAVFCCVGMGLTRYITAFYDELALTLKLRLITPDRPGIGDSESYADGTATPLSWPDDVYAICQTLKITKFSILAHSAGAIYALATALRMPQHIRGRIHLLAPWIPPSQMNTFGAATASPPTNAIPTSQRILRALPTPILKAANSSFMSATSSSITSSLPKTQRRKRKSNAPAANRDSAARRDVTPSLDKENIGHSGYSQKASGDSGAQLDPSQIERLRRQPSSSALDAGGYSAGNTAQQEEQDSEAAVIAAAADAMADKERQVTYDTRLTQAIWDLATTGANPAVDLLVCLERRHTIGFRYVDITRPVVIHHGSRDTRVPVDNVRWLGKTMRRCEVRVLEGEGHGLMASAGVMGSVLMEISKEWEDWMRVTGHSKKEERGRRSTLTRRD